MRRVVTCLLCTFWVLAAGSVVGQQTTFNVTVPSGTVTSGATGTQSGCRLRRAVIIRSREVMVWGSPPGI